ncbi:MAG: hypothetical protein HC796_09915 [Synechococcaceae cyanobacterium RL_1_2]|nr:hypothetical protein [Synechococcaceae cyanobacterium RL_1_2]
MIVDMLRNDLGRIAQFKTVQVPDLFTLEPYPTLWQMTSTVEARTQASFTDIMTALFPCASITGAPKPRTMEIIKELEVSPRHIYTGAIGFMAPHSYGQYGQFNVAIRTMLINLNTHEAEYGLGSGIVWDSDPEEEYQECQLKSAILNF